MFAGLIKVVRIYFILFYFNELPINKIKLIRVKKSWYQMVSLNLSFIY